MDSMQLSIEQEFSIHSLAEQIKSLSPEETQNFLIDIYRQMLLKDQYYQSLIRKKWNL